MGLREGETQIGSDIQRRVTFREGRHSERGDKRTHIQRRVTFRKRWHSDKTRRGTRLGEGRDSKRDEALRTRLGEGRRSERTKLGEARELSEG